jgi:hypothetical protein
MADERLSIYPTSLSPCLNRNCLNCRRYRPCPPLIVIAMRYARPIGEEPGR